MVDVRVGADAQIDCSDVVARKLKELGAATVKRFTPKLTHMVLSHFTPAWKAKIAKWQAGGGSMAAAATRYELKIVSQLWVNACYVSKQRMDERPFFPVSKAAEAAPPPPVKLKRRLSLGAGAGKNVDKEEKENAGTGKTEAPKTPPPSNINKTMNAGRRKRRALSMEPMTSDAILKMLGTTEATQEAVPSTPKQPIRSKSVSSSAKRRRTISCPPKTEDAGDIISASQATNASSIVAESESENENEDDIKLKTNQVIEIPDSQPSPAVIKKQVSPSVSTRSSSMQKISGELSVGTTDRSKKDPTARELRRRNRNSLTYGSGLTLKTGIWSCSACGCSNPRGRKFCTACQAPKGSAKSPTSIAATTASSPTASTVSESPKTPATPVETTLPQPTSSSATSVLTTPKRKKRRSAIKPKTPSPAVTERTSRSLTRATVSSAAKTRTPSPAVSRITGSASRLSTPSPAKRMKTPSPAPKAYPSSRAVRPRSATPSLGDASAPPPAPSNTPSAKKASRKPLTTNQSSTMKLTQSAAKRARPPVSSNTLTTPVVKKSRRDMNKENTVDEKHMATPGSVSLFPRKYRDVNSTPTQAIPMAMSFSSTTSRKTPRKVRNVIGITGVNSEKRGVLECAIHAIDANMCNDSGHRKARVVKSVDYAAGVTHLIVGKETRRTMKVLFAIARGAWIVTENWAFSSLEQERWLPEEDFELTMFANKFARLHPDLRQILKGMKFFVGSNVEPSREVLQSLIQVAGGEICKQISVADMCICGDASLFRRAQRAGIRVVTSKWVFDSIATMELEDDAKFSYDEPSDSSARDEKNRHGAASGLEAHSVVPE